MAWPDLHFEEANPRIHIGALRKVLGDRGAGARFIENVPGRGYCFVEASHPEPSRGMAVGWSR